MARLFLLIEKIFWIIAGVLTIIGSFGMLAKGGLSVYEDFSSLKSVLASEFFYAIICFELFQMAKIRIEGRSHKMVLYHFIFMVTLTLGREIFLIHNLSIWIVIGFSLMVLTYVLFYHWRDQFQDEVKAERGLLDKEHARREGQET
jgi:hypothetical protein